MGRFEFVESHGLLLFLALAGFAGVGEDGAVGPLRAVFRYGRAELGYEPVVVSGLGYEIVGAALHGLDGERDVAESRY